jgi:hypothetical protein
MPSLIGHPVLPLLLLLQEENVLIRKDAMSRVKINFFIVFYLVELFCIFMKQSYDIPFKGFCS